jgi:hypothetical protein
VEAQAHDAGARPEPQLINTPVATPAPLQANAQPAQSTVYEATVTTHSGRFGCSYEARRCISTGRCVVRRAG